jgi:hypothetical protein
LGELGGLSLMGAEKNYSTIGFRILKPSHPPSAKFISFAEISVA